MDIKSFLMGLVGKTLDQKSLDEIILPALIKMEEGEIAKELIEVRKTLLEKDTKINELVDAQVGFQVAIQDKDKTLADFRRIVLNPNDTEYKQDGKNIIPKIGEKEVKPEELKLDCNSKGANA